MLLSYIERAKLNTPVKANLSPHILMIRTYLDRFNAETVIATILILLLTKQFVLWKFLNVNNKWKWKLIAVFVGYKLQVYFLLVKTNQKLFDMEAYLKICSRYLFPNYFKVNLVVWSDILHNIVPSALMKRTFQFWTGIEKFSKNFELFNILVIFWVFFKFCEPKKTNFSILGNVEFTKFAVLYLNRFFVLFFIFQLFEILKNNEISKSCTK